MKKMKIKGLESLKNDLFQEQIVDSVNIRGGYGSCTYYSVYTRIDCRLYVDTFRD